jgi:hypothetical protein
MPVEESVTSSQKLAGSHWRRLPVTPALVGHEAVRGEKKVRVMDMKVPFASNSRKVQYVHRWFQLYILTYLR